MLQHRSPDSRIALGRHPSQSRTWADLIFAAETIREILELHERQRPAVSCRDRFWLTASLLAGAADASPCRPPNSRIQSLNEICRLERTDVLLYDGEFGPRGIHTSRLPEKRGLPDSLLLAHHQLVQRRGGQPLVTLYTSGSTGRPLRCQITAGQLLGEADVLADTFDMKGEFVVLSSAPAHHIYVFLFSVFVPLIGNVLFISETAQTIESLIELGLHVKPDILCNALAHLISLASAAHCLEKPFRAPKLLKVIERVLSDCRPLSHVVQELLLPQLRVTARKQYGSMCARPTPSAASHTFSFRLTFVR